MNYIYHLTIYLSLYAVVAMSLNMTVGYAGLMTLAQAGYFAVGSYVYALVSLKLGWGFLPALFLAVAISAVLSLAVSLPAWRLKGDFFVMASLAVQALILGAAGNWSSTDAPFGTWKNLTNGPSGLGGVPRPAMFGIEFDTPGSMALLSVLLAGLCLLLGWVILNSPWGRALKSMRDDELAARGLGKNVRLLKLQVFAVACGMAAVGGVIYASYVSYVDPSIALLGHSILMLCMVIVGGAGNFRGPLVGAFILVLIPELLRFVNIPDAVASEGRLMAYGVLLIAMMHYRPQGLAGIYRIE
jgi:branched-chain amino acid transport system permease protein